MKRLGALLCALVFGLGCASDGETARWDGFWQDLRGDNMQMRGDFTQTKALDDHSLQIKSRD